MLFLSMSFGLMRIFTVSSFIPSMLSTRSLTALSPRLFLFTHIVVRGLSIIVQKGMSSKPITDMSSGTLYPFSLSAFMTPIARVSFPAI